MVSSLHPFLFLFDYVYLFPLIRMVEGGFECRPSWSWWWGVEDINVMCVDIDSTTHHHAQERSGERRIWTKNGFCLYKRIGQRTSFLYDSCLQWPQFSPSSPNNGSKGVVPLKTDYIHSRHSRLFCNENDPPFNLLHLPQNIKHTNPSSLLLLFASSSTNLKTGYIGEFEIIDDHRAQKIVVELNGRLNKCGVISPRFDVEVSEIEKWIVNLLPSRQFGHIVMSTTYGIMTHEEARRKKTGGKVLGFFY